jgi:hypothetical protein
MKCKYCGSPASDAVIYCPACGEKLDGGVMPTMRPTEKAIPNTGTRDYAIQKEEGYDWLTTLLLAIFLGGHGVHRFYTGHTALGILMLFTFGFCGIMTLIDIIMIATGAYKDSLGRPLIRRQ